MKDETLESRERLNANARKWRKSHLWVASWRNAKCRCRPTGKYGRRGIKCLMTVDEFKEIWDRDRAWLLKRPSIDRINTKGHYVKDNCRYIELIENMSRGSVGRQKSTRLTPKQAWEIKNSKEPPRILKERYGLCSDAIIKIRNGTRWSKALSDYSKTMEVVNEIA